MFQPKSEYDVISDKIQIEDFHRYRDDFVTRPPYQRKSVWGTKKQQDLMDSLLRGYYIPKLVLREVRLDESRVVREVVDGQQRITTVQNFFDNKLKLPKRLESLDKSLPGKRYNDLAVDVRKFVDRTLKFEADVIKNIDDPKSPKHQYIATEIFWRLQQGESLNFMEIAHARLSSLVRNFITKHSDDISFDYDNYEPLDDNSSKHKFFDLIERKNDRMQHLSLLGRLLLIERAGGPTDVRDGLLAEWIDDTQVNDGIGNQSFQNDAVAISLLKTLNLFVDIFKDDPALDENNGIKELSVEYFIISIVTLVRHLRQYYAIDEKIKNTIRAFIYAFHQRWREQHEEDRDIFIFSSNRQQGSADLEARDRIVRQAFFEYLTDAGVELSLLDTNRLFNEAQRIKIYRDQEGLCQLCLAENKPRHEAQISWSEYQADHIFPWIKGGQTDVENAQVLCKYHNSSKGAKDMAEMTV